MRKTLLAPLLLSSSLALSVAPGFAKDLSPAAQAAAALAPVPKGKLSDAVVPSAYKIDMYVDPGLESFSGSTRIDVTIARPTRFIDLHGLDLDMQSARAAIDGKTYQGKWYQLDDTGVGRLVFDEDLPSGKAVLDFTYDHKFNRGTTGLFKAKVGDMWYAWNQFESIDARQAFPSFDQPGFKVPFTVTLRTRPGQVAVTNTPELSTTTEDGWEVHRFAQTKPLPTYLVAFSVGPFAVAKGEIPADAERANPVPLRIITTQQNADKMQFALDNTKKIIPLLENYFGRPYPYAKLDQISTPILSGAMENAGAVLYGDLYLMLGKNAPFWQQQAFGMIVSHELSHQWFGDLVTPAWWEDIWLNESFANWAGYRIGNEWRPDLKIAGGALNEGFNAMNLDALLAGRPIHQQIATNEQIDGAFDAITYGKGGQVIAMIAAFMGDEKFQAGVRKHLAAHAYGNATSDEFFAALADAEGDSRIVPAMKSFVEQQGVPLVTVGGSNGHYTVTQGRYARLGTTPPEARWGIPMCMRRGSARECKLFDTQSMAFDIGGTGALLPNAGGTGYYRFELPQSDWDALVAAAGTLEGDEAQAVADSLTASFLAGREGPGELIAAAGKFAVNPDSDASNEAGALLGALDFGNVLKGKSMEAFRKINGRTFGPQLAAMGFDPSREAYVKSNPDQRQRRLQLVNRLAFVARDKDVRKKLVDAAAAYLGGKEVALDQDYLVPALGVYVDEGDLARVKELGERALASHDPLFRRIALAALPRKGDKAIAGWLLNDFQDVRLSALEKLVLLNGVIAKDETRDFGIDWLLSHYEELVAAHGAINTASILPNLLSPACSVEYADRFEKQLGPVIAGTPGELNFKRTLEAVRDCGVLAKERGEEVRKAVLDAE